MLSAHPSPNESCPTASPQPLTQRKHQKVTHKRVQRWTFACLGLLGFAWLLGSVPTASSQTTTIPTTASELRRLSVSQKQDYASEMVRRAKRMTSLLNTKRLRVGDRTAKACYYRHQRKLSRLSRILSLQHKRLKKAVQARQSSKVDEIYLFMAQSWKQALLHQRGAYSCQPIRNETPTPKSDPVPAPVVAAKPKPAVKSIALPPKVAQVRSPRKAKRKKRNSRSRRLRERSTIDFDDTRIQGELTRPGSVGGRARGPRGGGAGKEGKKGKGGDNKPKARVWKRTKNNTILSKVSVGGGKFLQLKKFRVSVQVEGMRVRTIIDHIYHNPYNRTLQGTFKYTLPPDASVSYYAMFVGQRQRRTPQFFSGKSPSPRRLLRMKPQQIARNAPHSGWGKLREARLVPSEQGRQVYEEITRRRIDPALLEQDAPNTFTGRVFPIPAKGFNRVIIAYEETLPQIQNKLVYRLRFPNDVADMIDFTMGYNPKHARMIRSNLRALRCRSNPKKPMVRCIWEKNKPKKDAVFYFQPPSTKIATMAGTDPINSQKYMLAQARVILPKTASRHGSEQAIFLLDTSLSAQPDLFAAHVSLLRKVLTKNKHIKRFNVLFFDVGASWAQPKGWMSNTAQVRKKLWARIDRILLEGATNFGAAMQALARPPWMKKKKLTGTAQQLDVFVLSDGNLNWGAQKVDKILFQFQQKKSWPQVRFFAYQLGIGAENLNMLRQLVRQGGALFPCLGRAELDRCSVAHTRSSMLLERVEIKGIGASQILVAGRQTNVYPGGLITIGAQFKRGGRAKIHLVGQYQGKPFRQVLEANVQAQGDLGPRAWAEMAIAQLLELEDPKLRKLIVAYSQHFHIPNKYCSFLILETNKEYKQYGLEKELKTRKVADIASFLVRLIKEKEAPVTERQRWIDLVRSSLKRFKALRQSSGRSTMTLLHSLSSKDFEFTQASQGKLWLKNNVPSAYLKHRLKDRDNFQSFSKEARRRLDRNTMGAVRSLSCIVELHPSNPQALRLVAYYLRAWNRPDLAVRLFFRVLERRPFEPHAYRDVAISLMRLKRYALAAALYEVMLTGKWHSRFGRFKRLAREEYALLLYSATQKGKQSARIQRILNQRKSLLGLQVRRSGLRVTVTWNTDNTDIDLWVTGPTGHKCSYKKKRTPDGGRLLEDITRGYGPERYENKRPGDGVYKVQLQYYGHRTNVFGNETHISVLVVRKAGTPNQSITYKNLVLRLRKQVVNVARIKI